MRDDEEDFTDDVPEDHGDAAWADADADAGEPPQEEKEPVKKKRLTAKQRKEQKKAKGKGKTQASLKMVREPKKHVDEEKPVSELKKLPSRDPGKLLTESLSFQETFRVSPTEHARFQAQLAEMNEKAAAEGKVQCRSMSFFFRILLGLSHF